MEHDEYLDHSAGNGSLSSEEALIDKDARYESDGRSKMNTSFNANEGDRGTLMSDGERRPWSYFYDQHEGCYDDDRAERSRKANIRRDAATFCNYVDLTKHQQRRVLYHVDDLDLNEFGQTSAEVVILSLIAHVCNVDERWVQREKAFISLCQSLDICTKKVKRTTRQVNERVNE